MYDYNSRLESWEERTDPNILAEPGTNGMYGFGGAEISSDGNYLAVLSTNTAYVYQWNSDETKFDKIGEFGYEVTEEDSDWFDGISICGNTTEYSV